MAMERTMSSQVRDNAASSRFELEREELVAFATYQRQGSNLVIRHVESPLPLRGKGVAGELMQGIVDMARSEGWTITPLCSYAAAWMRRHQEYHDLLV
jgi:uncharacterized protein